MDIYNNRNHQLIEIIEEPADIIEKIILIPKKNIKIPLEKILRIVENLRFDLFFKKNDFFGPKLSFFIHFYI
jgi:hypothetical protein